MSTRVAATSASASHRHDPHHGAGVPAHGDEFRLRSPDIKLTSIYRGIIPFLVAPLVLVVLLFLFPGLALWLPKVLYG